MAEGWREYLTELHREKDLANGDAWCRRGEAADIFPNIARKYDRWIRFHNSQESVASGVEPLDDTLADLLIYATKYLLWLIARHPEIANAISANLTTDLTVSDTLTLITEMVIVERPSDTLVSSFEELEAIFAAGPVELSTPVERAVIAWALARAAWGELHLLPLPNVSSREEESQQTQPLASNAMTDELRAQLLALFAETPGRILILGLTPVALELRAQLVALGLSQWLEGIADPKATAHDDLGVVDWSEINEVTIEFLVVASDEEKEELLQTFARDRRSNVPLPTVIMSGMAHQEFRDPVYLELDAPALVPSYATGHPYTRIHMYQYLRAASLAGLRGAILEFGSFKGGTTAWLARVARKFELDGPIIGFDSWAGFPAPRSLLDMYSHPRCVFEDLDAVHDYLDPLGVELVAGDINDTAAVRLRDLPILLAFVDTDNYSPAFAALAAIVDNVVPGGAIVFDHFCTTQDFVYTLGERIAGKTVLSDRGFFQIHGTGVFVRLPSVGDPSHGRQLN